MSKHLAKVPLERALPAQFHEGYFLAGPVPERTRAANRFRYLALLADLRRQRRRVHSLAA